MRVSRQGGQNIDHRVDQTAVPGVFNRLDVLELVVDGFDDGPLASQHRIDKRHEFVAHVLADFRDELQSLLPEFQKESLGHVAPIPNEFTRQAVGQGRDGLTVVNIAWGQAKGPSRPPVVDHQMQLEPVEPAHGGLAAPRDLLEYLVTVDAAVVTDDQGRGIDEGDPGVDPTAGVQVDASWHQRRWDQGDEAAITQQTRKLTAGVSAPMEQIKCLEVTVLRLMKGDQDRHALAERQAAGPLPLALAAGEELAMPRREERPAELINITEQRVKIDHGGSGSNRGHILEP
jgi:hypothetical protein